MKDLIEQLNSARQRLQGQANITPVMTSRSLDAQVGTEVFCKCENYQRVGAFKFRGAFNAISRLDETQRSRGVLTHSSGNHAQAVALVGKLFDLSTTIVMPVDAPATKRAATEEYGATVVSYDPKETTREEVSARIQENSGMCLIPPYDHLDVIAGQGTTGLEFFDQAGSIDTLLVPCGGGGLLSGVAVAAKARNPNCRVIGIEPELADDATRSFYTRELQTVHNPPTIADGTRTPSLGALTFPLILENVDAMITVTEQSIVEAVRFLFYRMKLVVEPSGALPVAALLSGVVTAQGRTGLILSGGNIDAATMTGILTDQARADGQTWQ